MSTLVLRNGLNKGWAPRFEVEPLAEVTIAGCYDGALEHWGHTAPYGWSALTSLDGRHWDDHIDDCLTGSPQTLVDFANALRELAGHCREMAIWYAGFPDELQVVDSPEAFAAIVAEQLAAGDNEPAVRMVR